MQAILEKIVSQPQIHAKWLNTLSCLEFMGARKILRSTSFSHLDEQRLRHLAEETRHAHFFKMMIQRLDQNPYNTYNPNELFCGPSAIRYFHTLDACVQKNLKSRNLPSAHLARECYIYVTLLIEERATKVYDQYNQILKNQNIPISLKGILGEEDRHLEDMYCQLKQLPYYREDFTNKLLEQESKLFSNFYNKMAIALGMQTKMLAL